MRFLILALGLSLLNNLEGVYARAISNDGGLAAHSLVARATPAEKAEPTPAKQSPGKQNPGKQAPEKQTPEKKPLANVPPSEPAAAPGEPMGTPNKKHQSPPNKKPLTLDQIAKLKPQSQVIKGLPPLPDSIEPQNVKIVKPEAPESKSASNPDGSLATKTQEKSSNSKVQGSEKPNASGISSSKKPKDVSAGQELSKRSDDKFAMTWELWQVVLADLEAYMWNHLGVRHQFVIYAIGGIQSIAVNGRGPQGRTADIDFFWHESSFPAPLRAAFEQAVQAIVRVNPNVVAPDFINDMFGKIVPPAGIVRMIGESKEKLWSGPYNIMQVMAAPWQYTLAGKLGKMAQQLRMTTAIEEKNWRDVTVFLYEAARQHGRAIDYATLVDWLGTINIKDDNTDRLARVIALCPAVQRELQLLMNERNRDMGGAVVPVMGFDPDVDRTFREKRPNMQIPWGPNGPSRSRQKSIGPGASGGRGRQQSTGPPPNRRPTSQGPSRQNTWAPGTPWPPPQQQNPRPNPNAQPFVPSSSHTGTNPNAPPFIPPQRQNTGTNPNARPFVPPQRQNTGTNPNAQPFIPPPPRQQSGSNADTRPVIPTWQPEWGPRPWRA